MNWLFPVPSNSNGLEISPVHFYGIENRATVPVNSLNSEHFESIDQQNATENIEPIPFQSNRPENSASISIDSSSDDNQSDCLESNVGQNVTLFHIDICHHIDILPSNSDERENDFSAPISVDLLNSEHFDSIDQDNANKIIETVPYHSNGPENNVPISMDSSSDKNQSDYLELNVGQNGIARIESPPFHSNEAENSASNSMDSLNDDNPNDCLETSVSTQQNIALSVETVPFHYNGPEISAPKSVHKNQSDDLASNGQQNAITNMESTDKGDEIIDKDTNNKSDCQAGSSLDLYYDKKEAVQFRLKNLEFEYTPGSRLNSLLLYSIAEKQLYVKNKLNKNGEMGYTCHQKGCSARVYVRKNGKECYFAES